MHKIIEVRFGSDGFLQEEEKLFYIRYLNRILSVLKEDIISNKGYVNVISKKEFASNITFVSENNDLNKRVNLKLFNSPPLQYWYIGSTWPQGYTNLSSRTIPTIPIKLVEFKLLYTKGIVFE